MTGKEVFAKIGGAVRALFAEDGLTCACCGKDLFSDGHFCEKCLEDLPFNLGFICNKCGRAIGEDYPVCLECKAHMPAFDAARSAFLYEGEIVRLIRKFKTGAKYLADAFAENMYLHALSDFADADFAVCVPMTAGGEKRRGYNQSAVLAERVCSRAGLSFEEGVLVKAKETPAQKSLSFRERTENLKGAFRVHERKKCAGKNILIVDDVLTTAATGSAVAAALKSAGARKIYLLTAASVSFAGKNTVK